MNSQELLQELMKKPELNSYYAVAKKLGISTSFIYKIRDGEKHFGADQWFLAAEILGRDPRSMACYGMAERAKSDAARRAWQRGYASIGLLFSTGIISLVLWIMRSLD